MIVGKHSLARLRTCHPDLIAIVSEAAKELDLIVVCGHRTQLEQDACVDAGTSLLRWPRSKHNTVPSHAVDLAPYPLNWEDIESFKLLGRTMLRTASNPFMAGKIRNRIRWGGSWAGFLDFPHYEIVTHKETQP